MAFADPRIDLWRMMAGGLGVEAGAMLDRAALLVRGAVIEPADAREGDRRRAHRAGLQRHVEVEAGQAFGSDGLAGPPDRQHLRMRGRIEERAGLVAGAGHDPVLEHHHSADRRLSAFRGKMGLDQRFTHVTHAGHAVSLVSSTGF